MHIVPKSQLKYVVPSVLRNQIDVSKEAMGSKKRKREEVQQDMQPTHEKSIGDNGSSSSHPQQPVVTYKLYEDTIDASRVPSFFIPPDYTNDDSDCTDDDSDCTDDDSEEGGFYKFPSNDTELLNMSWKLRGVLPSFSKRKGRMVYHVWVDGDRCTAEACINWLKSVGCKEKRFISCSVEKPRLFFAELNKDEVAKLTDVLGIRNAYPRSGIVTKS